MESGRRKFIVAIAKGKKRIINKIESRGIKWVRLDDAYFGF